jgi:hypothetical protein
MFNPENTETFLRLRKEFDPLIKKLSSKVSYKRMGMTFEDIESLFQDKLIHVFLRYHNRKEWDELKYLTTRSLLNYLTRIYKKNSRPVNISLDDGENFTYIIPIEDEPSYYDITFNLFLEFLKTKLSLQDFNIFILLHYPPMYITSKIETLDKRIPSKLFLEFLNLEPTKVQVKKFNHLRRLITEKVQLLAVQYKQLEGIG